MNAPALEQISAAELIVFDLGNVLVDIDFRRICAYWAYKSGIHEVKEVARRYRVDESYESHERGEITTQQYFEHVTSSFNIDLDWQAFAHGWSLIFKPVNGLNLETLKTFAGKKRCVVLSNTNGAHIATAQQKFPEIFACLKASYFSHEIGSRKPETKIYKALTAAENIAPENILFFDDGQDNLNAANQQGWQTYLARSSSEMSQILANWLDNQNS